MGKEKKYTPMMEQYLQIKKDYKDAIVFFRLGDFYEMFFEDAITASRELELTLTGKQAGLEERVPMCGIPFKAYETYFDKLIAKGYKVAIVEQMEDPKTAKDMVKREKGLVRCCGIQIKMRLVLFGNRACRIHLGGAAAGYFLFGYS